VSHQCLADPRAARSPSPKAPKTQTLKEPRLRHRGTVTFDSVPLTVVAEIPWGKYFLVAVCLGSSLCAPERAPVWLECSWF
jgi:hypothetical protein